MEILEEAGRGGGGLDLLQTALAPGAQHAPVSLFCRQGGAVEGGGGCCCLVLENKSGTSPSVSGPALGTVEINLGAKSR